MVRSNVEDPRERLLGLLKTSELTKIIGDLHIRLDVARIDGRGELEISQRLRKLPPPASEVAQAHEGRYMVRGNAENTREGLFSLVELIQLLQRAGPLEGRCNIAWI